MIQVPIYPPQQTLADFTPDVCREVVRQSIGLPDIPVRLGTVRQWTMSSQVANRFQVCSKLSTIFALPRNTACDQRTVRSSAQACLTIASVWTSCASGP